MSGEPWNELALPAPSAQSSVLLPRDPQLLELCAALGGAANEARGALQSHRLRLDGGVLRSVLRVFRSRMRKHKPYRAVQQVDKCFTRLFDLKLELRLKELHGSCTSLPESMAGDAVYVPSRPFLEWMALLVMGASKLVLHTVAMCERAFLLVLHHLHLEEYITLNLLLTAVLSRLCLHGVSMAKGFEFPDALAEWLGPDFTHVLQIGAPLQVHKAKISSDLLELLFVASDETFGDSGAELVENPAVAAPAAATTAQPRPRSQEVMVPDIGKRLEQGGSRDAVECKLDWLMEKTQNTGHGSEREVKRDPGKSRIISCVVPAAPPAPVAPAALWLSSGACEATTFTEMTDALGALVRTCRRQHQRRPMLYLGGLRLKCARLAKLERLGYELQAKLRHMKTTVRRFMRRDVTAPWPGASQKCRAKLQLYRQASRKQFPGSAVDTTEDSESSPAATQMVGHSVDNATPGPHVASGYSLADQHGGPEGHTVFTGRMGSNTEDTHDLDIDDIFSALGC
ncbi:nucleolus and neural progenitor protein isoform X2 [Petromyzon marinus]|uniref:nucleolus and neural progenitor protein isoform X2 n=1 Tax=Petromyzon marinus TaxID=7757 RepID=UPI003F6ED577